MTEIATKSFRCRVAKAARMVAVFSALIALPLLAGCGENARASSTDGSEAGDRRPAAERGTERGAEERTGKDGTTGGERGAAERPEEDGARAGDAGARAGNAVAGAGGEAEEVPGAKPGADAAERAKNSDRGSTDAPEEVILKVKGNDARFTGTCSVGDEERRIDGRSPERYAFSPDGEELRCEIRGEGPGTLNVVLAAGDDVRSVQQSGGGESEVSLTYTGDRISVKQSSSGSGSQVQSSSVSDVSSRDTSAP